MNLLHWLLILIAIVGGVLFAVDRRRPRLAGNYLRYVVLALTAVAILTPFAWLAAAVVKESNALMQYVFLPPVGEWAEKLGLTSFRKLFTARPSLQGMVQFWQHLLNSVFIASAATVIQTLFCSMGGYALSKYRFRGQRAVMMLMLGSMTLPSMLLLAPLYKMMVGFGWMDSYLALLVPGAASAFGIFLFRQSMISVPDSLLEAARMDGASELFIYWRIIMPLVRPMTAAFCLIVFMGQWNAFIGPQIFLHTAYKLPAPVILAQYMTQFAEDYGVFLSGTFLAILPIAVLFLALQREFIAGLTSGAVKG
ncbi:MAG: carbohydrate ABC transporter permease [Opitutaceae bacterium]